MDSGRLTPAEAFRQFQRELRQYRLDTSLAALNHVWRAHKSADLASLPEQHWLQFVRLHELPYIAKALIQSTHDYRGRDLTRRDYIKLAGLYAEAQGLDVTDDFDSSDLGRFFIRLGYQQFRHQQARLIQLPRTLLLFDDFARDSEIARLFDIPGRFQQLTGFTIEEFVCLGFWLYIATCIGERPPFLELREERKGVPFITRRRVADFLARTAADRQQFQAECDKRAPAHPSLTLYAYNPLEATPVIRTQRSGFVVPYPPYLIDRITTGLYYDMWNEHQQRFSSAFGKVFEAYVGDLLKSVYSPEGGELYPELPYGRDRGKRSADWAVLEGDTGTLIECKITRLTLQTKVSADEEPLRRDLSKGIVDGLEQLHKVMQAITVQEPGLEPFSELKELVAVVVLLDPFPFANTPVIRDMVIEELRTRGVPPFDYQIISVDELEWSLPFVRERGLATLLREKMSDRADVANSSAYWNFQSYLTRVGWRRSLRKWPPRLRDRALALSRTFVSHFPELSTANTPGFLADDDAGADEEF